MTRKTWLFVCSLLIPGLIVIGIAIGMIFPRVSVVGTGSPPSHAPAAAGVRVEELTSAEEVFKLAGQEALVLKYSGGDMRFWIELQSDGKRQKLGHLEGGSGPFGSEPAKTPGQNQIVEGYLIWVRGEPDDEGTERWAVALRRDLVAAESSAIQVSSPLAQASVSQSKENRESYSLRSLCSVRVWEGNVGGRSSSYSKHIPNPLPTNREVCLMEIKERKRETDPPLVPGHDGGAGNNVTGIKQDTTDPKNESTGQHVIRVMCKVVSDNDRTDDDKVETK